MIRARRHAYGYLISRAAHLSTAQKCRVRRWDKRSRSQGDARQLERDRQLPGQFSPPCERGACDCGDCEMFDFESIRQEWDLYHAWLRAQGRVDETREVGQ